MDINKQLTANFKLKEFLRNKWFNKKDEEIADKLYEEDATIRHNIKVLAIQLQILRDYCSEKYGKDVSININIALRPIPYEIRKGRTGTSTHTKGLASDIRSSDISISELHESLLELIKKGVILDGGVGLYNTFIHYDFSMQNKARRW